MSRIRRGLPRFILLLSMVSLAPALFAQTLYVEMQIRGTDTLSPRESRFVRATTDGLLDTLWEAGYIVYDSGDPADLGDHTLLPNLLESARSGGAQLLLLVELETDRPGSEAPLTPRTFRYRLMDVSRGAPLGSGTAAVPELISENEVDRESYWLTLGGAVGREVLHAR